MKNSALQFTRQYVQDNTEYIDGNVAEHLILNVRSADQGYLEYLSEDEIEEYENATFERTVEIQNEIENWINDNFNFDISDAFNFMCDQMPKNK